MAFKHNSKLSENEPFWGTVDKTALPRAAFADQGEAGKKSTWSYPHHWIDGGANPDKDGIWTSGTMYLHKGGLDAAWSAANGGRSGKKASQEVIDHLGSHRKAIGADKEDNAALTAVSNAGRMLSAENESKIKAARDGLSEVLSKIDSVPEEGNETMKRPNNRLAQLFKDNPLAGKFEVKNQDDPEEATVYLYDAIGWYGIAAKDFVQALNSITAGTINLRIDSPGGSIFDARAMQTAIAQHPANVVAHIDGLAASCASWVALAANEVQMSDGAFMMIHQAEDLVIGNSGQMRDSADFLDMMDQSICKDYCNKTGMKPDEIMPMMQAKNGDGTWMTAQEAMDMGFIDKICTNVQPVQNRFNLSAYGDIPEALKKTATAEQPKNYDRERIERRLKLIEALG